MIQIHLKSKTNFYQAKSKQNLFSHQLNPVRLGDTEIVAGIWKSVLGQSNIISCRAVRFGYGRKPQIGKREQSMHACCMRGPHSYRSISLLDPFRCTTIMGNLISVFVLCSSGFGVQIRSKAHSHCSHRSEPSAEERSDAKLFI